VLEDILKPNLKVVFCGTRVGNKSAEIHHYYANPQNQFWAVLKRVELIPSEFNPCDCWKLPEYGIGLTDLAKQSHGTDEHISGSELQVGVKPFREKIVKNSPKIVAFNGKRAAAQYFGCDSKDLSYGEQDGKIGNSTVFVLPSTSPRARKDWDESHWKKLADFISAQADC
jgi:TDG/mug DNA glycosylase family protein